MRYVALLRGINVGGNNRLPMAVLRELATGLGWDRPTTYIASGNLVFDAPRTRPASLAARLEEAIEGEVGFRPRTLVLTGTQVTKVAAALPDDWVNDEERKTDVVYLLDGVTSAQAAATLTARDGIDEVVPVPGALIWSVRRSDATRSGLQKLIGTPLYASSTVRNANTARKLAELASA